MKIRTFKILLSRGWTKVMYSVSFFVFSLLSVNSNAQTASDSASINTRQSKVVVSGPKPAAGDLITGRVRNSEEPMMMVRVEEKDSQNRLVAHAVTDIDGNFSFNLVNPADHLEIINLGYHTAVSEFTGNSIDVTLVLDTLLINQKIDSILNAAAPDIIRDDRYQGMRARAYGPQYPIDGKPLIVFDGKVLDLDSYKRADFDFEKDSFSKEKVADLLDIKPEQIKSISYLKDDAATKFWGSRGTNGVLEVLSKKQYRKIKKEGKK